MKASTLRLSRTSVGHPRSIYCVHSGLPGLGDPHLLHLCLAPPQLVAFNQLMQQTAGVTGIQQLHVVIETH